MNSPLHWMLNHCRTTDTVAADGMWNVECHCWYQDSLLNNEQHHYRVIEVIKENRYYYFFY